MAETGLKLFAVLVGGEHPRARLELHDMMFVAATDLRATWPTLRRLWWGTPSSLHIDAWALVERVDGHAVRPVPPADRPAGGPSLYFVNTGGYRPGVLSEEHAYTFHVGAEKAAVWKEARARASGWTSLHKDNFEAVDDVICVDAALGEQGMALALVPEAGPDRIGIVARYEKMKV